MVCVGLSERDLNNFGGARQNFLGEVALPGTPLAPPLYTKIIKQEVERWKESYKNLKENSDRKVNNPVKRRL